MSKRGIAVVVLLIVSVVVMIYKAETSYQHLAAANKWGSSFGYGFSPWVIGLAVAAIKEGWAQMRKRTHNFTRSLLWATGVLAVLMVPCRSAGAPPWTQSLFLFARCGPTL